MNNPTEKLVRYSCIFFLAITLIKILYVVFSSPVYGYANNYDFLRESSCTGLYQSFNGRPNLEAMPSLTLKNLIYDGKKRADNCLQSSDNVFSYLAAIGHRPGDFVDIRSVGLFRIITLLSLVFIALLILRKHIIIVALSSFFIFSDIHVLLYANTLYADFSALTSLFISGLLFVSIAISAEDVKPSSVIIFILCIFWLGLSKEQYLPLASLLALILAFKYLRKNTALALVLFAACALIPAIYFKIQNWHTPYMNAMVSANHADSILGAILPASSDKLKALDIIGLPASCENSIGQTWYSPGFQKAPSCPEVFKLRRTRLIWLFIDQPETFFAPLHRAMSKIYPLYPAYLSVNENNDMNRKLIYKALLFTSPTAWLSSVNTVSHRLFVFFVFLISVIAPILSFLALIFFPKARRSSGLVSVSLGGTFAFYSIFSSVFGDGYAELAKHASGFIVGFAFVAAGFLQLIISDRLLSSSH